MSQDTAAARISGFSRNFITYAEQMQLFALLAFGLLLANLKSLRNAVPAPGYGSLCRWPVCFPGPYPDGVARRNRLLYSGSARHSRSDKGRRAILLALVVVMVMASVSIYMVRAIRRRTRRVLQMTAAKGGSTTCARGCV